MKIIVVYEVGSICGNIFYFCIYKDDFWDFFEFIVKNDIGIFYM